MEFAPAIYEHAAKLIGKSPWEASRNPELILQAHAEAYSIYHHRPVVVGIDIYNLEAEAYGAPVTQPQGNGIPAIGKDLCPSVADIVALPPLDPLAGGRIPDMIQAAKQLQARFPEADVKIPVGGPFSIASNLLGFENLLCETFSEPDAVRKALEHLVDGQIAFCAEIVNQGLDISFFESAATPPMISPDMFREVELPPLARIIQEASRITGKQVSCVMGGDTFPILETILETGTGFVICPCETDQPAFLQSMQAHPEVMVRVNMDGKFITQGDTRAIHEEVDRLLTIIDGRENACIGAGAIPYEANPEVVLNTMEYVKEKG